MLVLRPLAKKTSFEKTKKKILPGGERGGGKKKKKKKPFFFFLKLWKKNPTGKFATINSKGKVWKWYAATIPDPAIATTDTITYVHIYLPHLPAPHMPDSLGKNNSIAPVAANDIWNPASYKLPASANRSSVQANNQAFTGEFVR